MIVQLRKRKLANGITSLYLAYWNPDHKHQVTRGKEKGQWKSGRWEYEFLKLYLGTDKAVNKETLQLAKNLKNKRQVELQSRQHGFKSQFEKKGNFVSYFQDIKEKKYPEYLKFAAILKHLREFTGGYISFEKINKEWLENFKTYLLTKVSQNTASGYFLSLNLVLKMAVKEEIIDKEPGRNVKLIKMIEVKKVYLTFDEINALVTAPCQDESVKWSFLFSCFTGLRISDLRRLTWGDIKKDERGYKLEFRQKKTEGVEYLPLCETAVNFLNLEEATHQDDKIFHIPEHQGALSKLFDSWTAAAGVKKKVRFHTGRHTFATLCLTYGVDLYTVSKLLGHRNISTTQVYAKVIDKKKRDAVRKLPSIN